MTLFLLGVAVCALLALPFGKYMVFALSQPVTRFESFMGLSSASMGWKKWAVSIGLVSALSLVVLFVLFVLAGFDGFAALSSAVSYVTNTNWQPYTAETLPLYVQAFLLVQNFVAPAVAICVLAALCRSFAQKTLGNFWLDLFRIVVWVLLPLAAVYSVVLGLLGVAQTVFPSSYALLEGGQGYVPGSFGASQTAISLLGTNGGSPYTAGMAHPLANPGFLTNLIECVSILFVPMACVFFAGNLLKNRRQGYAIFALMLVLLVAFGFVAVCFVPTAGVDARLSGTSASLWAMVTTASSNGSTNLNLSAAPASLITVCLVLMELGEVVFGGVGTGMLTMIGLMCLSVFIAGLMVGRTPELFHKKITPAEMKWTVLLTCSVPVLTLLFAFALVFASDAPFTSCLYLATSLCANNGTSLDMALSPAVLSLSAVFMTLARFVPLVSALALASRFARKDVSAQTSGTLSTTSPLFIGLLFVVLVLVGALTFFPALALGPLAAAL